jgi:hypothetical protein
VLEFTPRDHIVEDGEVIGTFTDNGKVISEERTSLPLSGPISLSSIGVELGQGTKMWMSNGYLKDLIQDSAERKRLSQFYGAAWGQPHQTVNQGVGMQIVKWDWRFDGNSNVTDSGHSTSGAWGDTTAKALIYNNNTMAGPSAYSGNGYSYMQPGNYTLSFRFSERRQIDTQPSSNGFDTNCYVAVYGYYSGYLSGARSDLVPFTEFATGSLISGNRSYNFTVPSSRRHVVINFNWWCDQWKGAVEGIECAISNAKVVRTS